MGKLEECYKERDRVQQIADENTKKARAREEEALNAKLISTIEDIIIEILIEVEDKLPEKHTWCTVNGVDYVAFYLYEYSHALYGESEYILLLSDGSIIYQEYSKIGYHGDEFLNPHNQSLDENRRLYYHIKEYVEKKCSFPFKKEWVHVFK